MSGLQVSLIRARSAIWQPLASKVRRQWEHKCFSTQPRPGSRSFLRTSPMAAPRTLQIEIIAISVAVFARLGLFCRLLTAVVQNPNSFVLGCEMQWWVRSKIERKALCPGKQRFGKPDNKLKCCVFKRPEKRDGLSDRLVEGISVTKMQSSTVTIWDHFNSSSAAISTIELVIP